MFLNSLLTDWLSIVILGILILSTLVVIAFKDAIDADWLSKAWVAVVIGLSFLSIFTHC